MRRILFRTADATYRAFAFEFNDAKDGSLYIQTTTARQPDGSGGKTLWLSYHPTGRLNFKGAINETLYSEPIFAISKSQQLFSVSLANIDKLPCVSESRPDDLVVDCTALGAERLSLYIFITPPDAPALDLGALVVPFENWFTIQVLVGPPPENDIAPGTNRVVVVGDWFFTEQQVGQEQALIFFHQKRTGSKDAIIYWEAANKWFRIIFPVPMRVPPNLSVEFAEPGLHAEQEPPLIRNTDTAELRFKVRGPGGILPDPATIAKLMLDSEL